MLPVPGGAPLRPAEPPRESSSPHPVAIAAASDAQTRAPRSRLVIVSELDLQDDECVDGEQDREEDRPAIQVSLHERAAAEGAAGLADPECTRQPRVLARVQEHEEDQDHRDQDLDDAEESLHRARSVATARLRPAYCLRLPASSSSSRFRSPIASRRSSASWRRHSCSSILPASRSSSASRISRYLACLRASRSAIRGSSSSPSANPAARRSGAVTKTASTMRITAISTSSTARRRLRAH